MPQKPQVIQNQSLAEYTSFGVGGNAEHFVIVQHTDELPALLAEFNTVHIIGYGTNYLVSDKGLPGLTIVLRTKDILFNEDDSLVVADSGVWWDDVVQATIDKNKWGLALMSGIPGGVGGAVVGNIAAYGQAVSNSLAWVEVIDTSNTAANVQQLKNQDLDFDYRQSKLQDPENRSLLITRAAFALSDTKTKDLKYENALMAARDMGLDPDNLQDRRDIIMETRKRGGSLQDRSGSHNKTGGSFFRNPLVTPEQADHIMEFEEREVTKQQIKQQNRVHGGDSFRMSAALVLLAAGFERGQTWGQVRLHPDHILKVENIGGASSKEIYDVTTMISTTVQDKLGITLQAEVNCLGDFS